MKVVITGYLAELAGNSEIDFELPDATPLPEFLEQFLFAGFPSLRTRIMDECGLLRPHIAIFVNQTRIRKFDLESIIDRHSEVFILPALSGG